MYATEWSKYKENGYKLNQTFNNAHTISRMAPLVWAEHCVECAEPQCYRVCAFYKKREDGRCKLLTNGLLKRNEYNGILGYGVEAEFQNWSKLEATCNVGQYPVRIIKIIDKTLHLFSNVAYRLSRILEKNSGSWKITTVNYKIREGISLLLGKTGGKPDCFLIQTVNPNEHQISLIVEVKTASQIKYRNVIVLKKGYSEHSILYQALNIENKKTHKILVYPEDMTKVNKIIFTALDFVKLNKNHENKKSENREQSKKIKCVVWDLDHTLWDGVLIEDKEIKLNEKAVSIIKELDRRGIINSIASKNDYDVAYAKLKELQLEDYFVMPRINWNPKSINLKQISKDINIGLNTIAFVDDNAFEREEVKSAQPEILCLDVKDIDQILNKEEFDVVVTEDTINRRKTYKMLEKQMQEMEKWEGNIDDFLKSCNMKLFIRKPKEEELLRCYELIQRTNQLNSSGRRLNIEEIKEIYQNPNYETYILICEDKFGSYGIVGFSIVQLNSNPTITDFVISCRVANKKVENTYITYLAEKYKKTGCSKLYMNYKKTTKNGPIFNVVKDLGMKNELKNEVEVESFFLTLSEEIYNPEIIQVIANE